MGTISRHLRKLIIRRAGNRCEYCHLSQAGQEAAFHVDHILPIVDGGPTTKDNLALACVSCSLRKEARRMAVDPETGRLAQLFHPRRDAWNEHFSWNGLVLQGRTAKGRATISALKMNRPVILAIRKEEEERGRHPPPQDSHSL